MGFYGGERETVFPDTIFSILIAFETILPIWLCAWCISKIRPAEFSDEEIDELVDEQMPIITKNQNWEDDYESDIEHGDGQEYDENDEAVSLFAPPQILDGGDNEQENNWDILRVYTDIDEEIEFLEDNYMPDEMKWHKKKRKKYNLQKVGYVPMDNSDDSLSPIESYEERRGFEGQNHASHWHQARDAAELGFIPVNEDEEYDAAASKMLHDNKKENLKQKRKQRSERENSVSSKISSIFRSSDKKQKEKKKKKKDKKRRRSSTLSKLLSFGSKTASDNAAADDDEYEKVEQDKSSQQKEEYENEEQEPLSNEYTDDDEVDGDDNYYDDDEEEEEEVSETSSERRRRRKKEKKKKKKNKKKKPAMSSMNAPKPMQTEIELEHRPKKTKSSKQKKKDQKVSKSAIAASE